MREFCMIFAAGLISSVLGGGFGWLVGRISPEFIQMLAQPYRVQSAERLAAAMGTIAGLLIGAAAMAFGLLISAIRSQSKRSKIDLN
jgi:hypothetical protein